MIDSLPARITDKIHPEPNSGCWLWAGCRNRAGYGQSQPAVGGGTKNVHRITWAAVNGPIPKGLFVLHRCDNPPCCNPDHLFLGTHADNSADRVAKGRQARGERNARAKHTEQQILQIRRRYAQGESQVKLAVEYGIARRSVSRICSRDRWAHV